MDDIERLITAYADWVYAILFVYAFVKTGPLPVAAAYAASLGWLHAGGAMAAVAVGAFLGDQVRFEAGRRFGPAALARLPRWRDRAGALATVCERHHVPLLALFRFAKGVRTPVSVCLGLTRLSRIRFTGLNAVTAIAWSATLSGLGLTAGAVLDPGQSLVLPVAGLVLMAAIVGATGWAVRRELARRLAEAAGGPAPFQVAVSAPPAVGAAPQGRIS